MTRAEVVGVIERRIEASNRRDVAALTALHAENGVVESLIAGRVEGRAAIGDVYRAWFTAFPDVVVTTDELIVESNRAVQVATITGTDLGGFMGVPATGKPFRMSIVFLFTVVDGLIAYERRIYDFTGLLLQIGVLKAKPA